MSIQCTYADLEKLRDTPSQAGPLTKLAMYEEDPKDLSVIDLVRRMRFLKALIPEVTEYARAVATLGEKCGKPTQDGKFFIIDPDKQEMYKTEKAKIDAESLTILVQPLPPSAYSKVPLTALDLLALEPFIILPEDTSARSPATPPATAPTT